MANIKVSEMTEATSFDNGDYTMIVQANQNKKIARENILGDIEDDISTINTNISSINTNIGDLTDLENEDKSSVVNSINELKSAEVYSTNEVKTNSIWIDGKPLYRKTINTGALPNNTGKTVNHNISNIEYIYKIQGITFRNSNGTSLPLPSATYDNTAISCYADRQKITIVTYTDRSSFTDSYVTLEYTKTTD